MLGVSYGDREEFLLQVATLRIYIYKYFEVFWIEGCGIKKSATSVVYLFATVHPLLPGEPSPTTTSSGALASGSWSCRTPTPSGGPKQRPVGRPMQGASQPLEVFEDAYVQASETPFAERCHLPEWLGSAAQAYKFLQGKHVRTPKDNL